MELLGQMACAFLILISVALYRFGLIYFPTSNLWVCWFSHFSFFGQSGKKWHISVVVICTTLILSKVYHYFICLEPFVFIFCEQSISLLNFGFGFWLFSYWFVRTLYILEKLALYFWYEWQNSPPPSVFLF